MTKENNEGAAEFAARMRRRKEILDEVGGAIGADEVALILKLPVRAVIDLATKGRLLALFPPDHATYEFPAFQFDRRRGALLAGMEEVLKELSAVPEINNWAKCQFLLSRRHSLRDQTPLALLRRGKIARVVALAGAYAS